MKSDKDALEEENRDIIDFLLKAKSNVEKTSLPNKYNTKCFLYSNKCNT